MKKRSNRDSDWRRQNKRKYWLKFAIVVLSVLVIFGTVIYILNLPNFRLQQIEVKGNQTVTTTDLELVTQRLLDGRYFWLIPRDSYLFWPKSLIRKEILDKYLRLKEVALSRSGATMQIAVTERKPRALWCPGDGRVVTTTAGCYFLDPDGLVFTLAPAFSSFSNNVFVSFLDKFGTTTEPLGQYYLTPTIFNTVLVFLNRIDSIGVAVSSLIVRPEGYYEIYLKSGTRLLVSDRQDLNKSFRVLKSIADDKILNLEKVSRTPELEYLDLRFDNKIYYKKRGEQVQTQPNI